MKLIELYHTAIKCVKDDQKDNVLSLLTTTYPFSYLQYHEIESTYVDHLQGEFELVEAERIYVTFSCFSKTILSLQYYDDDDGLVTLASIYLDNSGYTILCYLYRWNPSVEICKPRVRDEESREFFSTADHVQCIECGCFIRKQLGDEYEQKRCNTHSVLQ